MSHNDQRPISDCDECVGCGACVKYCPDACFYPWNGCYLVDVECCCNYGPCNGECSWACPVDALKNFRNC